MGGLKLSIECFWMHLISEFFKYFIYLKFVILLKLFFIYKKMANE